MELLRGNKFLVMEVVRDKWNHFQEWYDWTHTFADKRVENWFLMQSYTPTLVLTALYLFSIWAGKRIMANREPFNFKYILFLYNMGLVGLNAHIVYELLTCSIRLNYNYLCQPVNYDPTNELELRIAKALWWYYFSKCIEFMDTIFFVLRKKNNQISFLHVYHHATMFPIWWCGVKWVAGGQAFFGSMINSFIHVLMYGYYGVSALGKEYQKYLWWKRYLTVLQLIQFFIGMVYSLQHMVFDCRAAPKWFGHVGLVYGSTLIALFMNFYIRTYTKYGNKILKQVKQVTKNAAKQGKELKATQDKLANNNAVEGETDDCKKTQ
ncbi:unnamed protein product [Owenia fusiformis]|uniref:Elongation of very long chain fatty acids protein n=1 Tax=Owenia fusiformis TaxID=6347 RepID=A0A8J1UIV8_OWEFU|nr:unnamed protein product [Owenia fusiformis]